MGRASNRKKAQRRAELSSGQARQGPRADAETQQAMRLLAGALQTLAEEGTKRKERVTSARRVWCGGADPVPAEPLRWLEDSLGDRFFGGTSVEEARAAPCLLTAQIPDAAVIATDPGHWNVAIKALIRAVAFDGLAVDHPAVRTLLEALAPIAETELAYYGKAVDARPDWTGPDPDDGEPEFPELDGPLFLLGACALMDALWAAVGEDPLTEVRRVLVPVLADAAPDLNSEVAADALIGAFATEYRCELPGDAELLKRIGHLGGDPLENLVTAGAVPPGGILPVGLAILSALAHLCRSGSASVLQPAA